MKPTKPITAEEIDQPSPVLQLPRLEKFRLRPFNPVETIELSGDTQIRAALEMRRLARDVEEKSK